MGSVNIKYNFILYGGKPFLSGGKDEIAKNQA